jgi:hypothetical protein
MDHLLEPLQWTEAALYRALALESTSPSTSTSTHALAAFRAALQDLGQADPASSKKAWGDWHQAPFQHLSGAQEFSVTPLPTDGDENSVNPGTQRWNGKGWDHTQGASQRLVVELSDPPVVYAALAGSQEDLERPDLREPKGPWKKLWADCTQEKKLFPWDWSQGASAQAVPREVLIERVPAAPGS